MTTLTIKEFVKSKGFTQITTSVRVNTNGYPFITFIDANNKAENIYFSKRSSENVAEGELVTKELLQTHQIGISMNANGEERIKIISNSDRINLSDLLD